VIRVFARGGSEAWGWGSLLLVMMMARMLVVVVVAVVGQIYQTTYFSGLDQRRARRGGES
jgi:hypothetical protein